MKYKITDLALFKRRVFGADSILQYWPELTTTGIEIEPMGEYFYIMVHGQIANDTAFFNSDEMQYLEKLV